MNKLFKFFRSINLIKTKKLFRIVSLFYLFGAIIGTSIILSFSTSNWFVVIVLWFLLFFFWFLLLLLLIPKKKFKKRIKKQKKNNKDIENKKEQKDQIN